MNEREIISCLNKKAGDGWPGLRMGIGDDCAVIDKDARSCWLVTMDTLVEGIHFDLRWHPPELLGRKAVAVNVSDIAAMGGMPVFVFLSLGLPGEFDRSWLEGFSDGVSMACREQNCFLAGGDTVRSREGILVTITLIGEMEKGQVVYRSGALPGDTVWVSGTLGSAAAGLEICRQRAETDKKIMESLVMAHLDPSPRVRLGRALAESRLVHAMMDLSDGLATDLSHLCARSNVGAAIRPEALPASPALHDACSMIGKRPIDLMVSGGEDYELLFTAAADRDREIALLSEKTGVQVTPVGTIVKRPGVRLVSTEASGTGEEEVDISYTGYDHFPEK